MAKYPGQDLSLDQLFYALNAKILEQSRIYQSSVSGPDQRRWVSTWVAGPRPNSGGLTVAFPFPLSRLMVSM